MPKDQSQLPMELQVMKKCQGKDQGSDEFFQKKKEIICFRSEALR